MSFFLLSPLSSLSSPLPSLSSPVSSRYEIESLTTISSPGLKAQYRSRRNILVDSLLSLSHAGLDTRSNTPTFFSLSASTHSVGIIREKDSTLASRPLISFVAPQGGMFVWLRIHFSEHEKYAEGSKTTAELTMELWELIAQSNVLVAPGTMVRPICLSPLYPR